MSKQENYDGLSPELAQHVADETDGFLLVHRVWLVDLHAENADLKASLAAMAGLTGEQAEQLRAENERLRTLVCAAYCEGFGDGPLWREVEGEHTEERHDADVACGSMWPRSKACAALAGDDG